jgi:hypothetical protein
MFPQSLHYHIAPMVTDLVKWLRDAWEPAFDAFNNIVLAMLLKIEAGLMVVPWWLWILLVMVLSWYLSKHIGKTLLPALLLFSIGVFGLWGTEVRIRRRLHSNHTEGYLHHRPLISQFDPDGDPDGTYRYGLNQASL